MPDSFTPHLLSRRCAFLISEESSIISDFIKYIQCYACTILEQDQKRYFHIKASIQKPHRPAVLVEADVSDVTTFRIIRKKVQPNHTLSLQTSYLTDAASSDQDVSSNGWGSSIIEIIHKKSCSSLCNRSHTARCQDKVHGRKTQLPLPLHSSGKQTKRRSTSLRFLPVEVTIPY